MQEIKIIDLQDRKVLFEGRNYQMGFAFCKKTGENEFTTTHPISPCKDYLNDVLLSELLGVEVIGACGLNYSKHDIFSNNRAFIAFKICMQGASSLRKYNGYSADVKRLNENFKVLEIFINFIEDSLKINEKTQIYESTTPGLFLADFSLEWCKTTYAISLYSLFLRLGQFYVEGDVKKFLEEYPFVMDKHLWGAAKPRYEYFIKHGLPKQDLKNYMEYPSSIHGVGVLKAPIPASK